MEEGRGEGRREERVVIGRDEKGESSWRKREERREKRREKIATGGRGSGEGRGKGRMVVVGGGEEAFPLSRVYSYLKESSQLACDRVSQPGFSIRGINRQI